MGKTSYGKCNETASPKSSNAKRASSPNPIPGATMPILHPSVNHTAPSETYNVPTNPFIWAETMREEKDDAEGSCPFVTRFTYSGNHCPASIYADPFEMEAERQQLRHNIPQEYLANVGLSVFQFVNAGDSTKHIAGATLKEKLSTSVSTLQKCHGADPSPSPQ